MIFYYFDSCPFCIRVLNHLSETGVEVKKKNIMQNPSYREELMTKGGKTQVPALEVDEKIIYESSEIIDWLEKNA